MDSWDDACAQAELVRSGKVSASELVESAISRVQALDPRLNAVVTERFDEARAEVAADLPQGPFRGVPLVLKDLNCPSRGDRCFEGTRFLQKAGFVADHDSATVRRFRQAGFVILGRTNTPELGASIATEPMSFGPSRNPWDPSRSTGGSSGGSAAAVASGMVAVGHGNDGGGSMRIPASMCGLVGLKPTRARVSRAPDAGEGRMGASTTGALARTVRDAAAILDVLAGPEPGDPYPAPPLRRPLSEEVGADPGRLRIGLLDHPANLALPDPQTAAAVASTGRLLERLGHHVETAHPPALNDPDYAGHFGNVVAVGTAADVATWAQVLGREVSDDELEPATAALIQRGRALAAPRYVQTINWLHAFSRRMAQWWEAGWDVLVSPVLNGVPPEIGWLTDPGDGAARVGQMNTYTSQFNVTGQPAISLPLHTSREGLPLGVQLAAAIGREDILIRLSAQLEAAQPWASRHPVVSIGS
jgi:amidase